jgi:uncharacterized membrane protein SirB2
MYIWLKYLHVACAGISIGGFIVRGIWMMRDSPQLQQRWVRVAPHIVDTLLLASALALAWRIHQWPFTHDWLTAKVVGLLAYIVLGSLGLKRAPTRRARVLFWALALLTFGYIALVAVTRSASLGVL